MAAFVHATVSWLDDPEPGLGERIDLAHRELRALLIESTPTKLARNPGDPTGRPYRRLAKKWEFSILAVFWLH
jgi:hypothetical protein